MRPCVSTPREVMEAICCGSAVAHTIDVEKAKIFEESKLQSTQNKLQEIAIKRIGKLGKKATIL